MADWLQGRRVAAPSRGLVWLLLATLVAVWFCNLEQRKLVRPDEGRYAELARHMVVSGDWVTPRLNGIKYFFKPPLQYWATAGAYSTFGMHHWTARLWSAVTGLAGILLMAFVAWRLYGPTVGLYTGAVLASAGLYVAIGHLNTLDMGLTLFMTGVLAGVLLAQRNEATDADRRIWMHFAWACAALAVLSKGLIGIVLPGAAVVLYILIDRNWRLLTRMHVVTGSLLFLAIAAPWFVAVSLRNPEFFHFFFIHEHFERFLTPVHRRDAAWWFFLEIHAIGFLPWLLPMIAGIAGSWRVERSQQGFRPTRLVAIWVVFIVLFFSLSSSKLPSYTLPVWPACALLTALAISRMSQRAFAWQIAPIFLLSLLAACSLALLMLTGGLEQLVASGDRAPMVRAFAQYFVAGLLVMSAGSAWAWWSSRRGRVTAAVVGMAMATLVGWQLLIAGHERMSPSTSAYHLVRAIAPEIERDLHPETPFYSVEVYEQTLNFYIRRETTLVSFRDELDFGLRQEPWKAIDTLDAFEPVWRAQPVAFAIMQPHTFEALTRRGLPMVLLARDSRRVIVRTPPGH
ncbi:MAG: glycosyltransferase family 39 protein [Proteobacteria bacterium]|nr:glycosyltransferase family 39 protein [Pseudomonadota bacterium]